MLPITSIGSGKTIVWFFSELIEYRVWKSKFPDDKRQKLCLKWEEQTDLTASNPAEREDWSQMHPANCLIVVFPTNLFWFEFDNKDFSWGFVIGKLIPNKIKFWLWRSLSWLIIDFHDISPNPNSLEDISAASQRNSRKWFLRLPSELEQLFVHRPLRSPGVGINRGFNKKQRMSSSVFILTLALASLAASASAAMALCSWTGSRQSLLKWFWFCFVRRGTLRHQRAHRDHSQHSELSRSRLVYTRPELRAQLRRFRAHMLLMLLIQRCHATLIGQLKLKWPQAKRRELRRHLKIYLTLLS